MAYGYYLEAEYETGFVLREDENDHSPYDPGSNIFHAILNKRPSENGHGRMVRFSLIGPDKRYDIDWTELPADARPIYYRKMTRKMQIDGSVVHEAECNSHHFGWQGTVGGEHAVNVEDIGSL